LCLKKPSKMIERSESSLNNPENNCHSQNNQKNQLHFFWKSTDVLSGDRKQPCREQYYCVISQSA
ncbi:MAG: hypothetical protein WA081_03795, partial [Desulfosalsimonadaceae bacterium]